MTDKCDDRCDIRVIHQQKVSLARQNAIDQNEACNLAQFFKAFADPGRIRILSALSKQEMCVCDLAAFLESSESAVSHQLRLLRTMKLVQNRREGKVLYYRLVDCHIQDILSMGSTHCKE